MYRMLISQKHDLSLWDENIYGQPVIHGGIWLPVSLCEEQPEVMGKQTNLDVMVERQNQTLLYSAPANMVVEVSHEQIIEFYNLISTELEACVDLAKAMFKYLLPACQIKYSDYKLRFDDVFTLQLCFQAVDANLIPKWTVIFWNKNLNCGTPVANCWSFDDFRVAAQQFIVKVFEYSTQLYLERHTPA